MTLAWSLGTALTGLALPACRQILGLDVPFDAQTASAPEGGASEDGASEATSACDPTSGTPTCVSCIRANCCSEWSSCTADPVFCAPYESCLSACNGDAACRSQCTIDHPIPATSAAPVSTLAACLAANCETECGLTCGAFAGYLSEPDASADCQSCLQQNACPHARACGSSAECDEFWRCFLACSTVDCKDACVEAHDAGAAEYKTLFQDFSGTCAGPCGFGNYWACAGHVGFPAAKSSSVTWTNWVYDVGNQAAVADAAVSICGSCPCPAGNSPLLGQGQTGADGFFTVQVQQVLDPNGQAQPFCVETNASGYLTSFLYTGLPFSEPSSSIMDSLAPYVSLGIVLFSPANVQVDTDGLGGTYDPKRGMIAAGIFDCLANPADGVYVTINSNDPQVILAVPVDAGPGAGLTTRSGGLNTVGHAVFFNVAPGSYLLSATPPGFGRAIDQVTVTVAASTVTQIGVFPSP
jgi:hypothetical protein